MVVSAVVERIPALRRTLLANAGFSLLCSLSLLLFPELIAGWLGDVPKLFCIILGVLLAPFAFFVYWVQHHLPASRRFARDIFVADVLWVALTPMALWWFGPYLSAIGYWVAIDIALIVAVFAALEWIGLRRLYHGLGAGA